MTNHTDYAPKRNPAAAIEDHNVRKLPAFMRRQDQPPPADHLAALESDLASYIDSANTETAVETETVQALDLVAGLQLILKRLTYSQMKGVAGGLVSDKPISTAAEMADALEAFASKEQAA